MSLLENYLGLHWVISLLGLVLHSVKSLGETAVTHRPQGVIIVGIYMSANVYYLRGTIARRIALRAIVARRQTGR